VPAPDRADEFPLQNVTDEINGFSIFRFTINVNELEGAPNVNEKICYKFKIQDTDREKYEVRGEIDVV
jgi:hypothetical protein